jgi:hypothetical protein
MKKKVDEWKKNRFFHSHEHNHPHDHSHAGMSPWELKQYHRHEHSHLDKNNCHKKEVRK